MLLLMSLAGWRSRDEVLGWQFFYRGTVVCSDRKSPVSEWQILVMLCRWRREVVQALSPEAPHG